MCGCMSVWVRECAGVHVCMILGANVWRRGRVHGGRCGCVYEDALRF